jgi:hypothetical protein
MNVESRNVAKSVTGVMQCFDPTDNTNTESQICIGNWRDAVLRYYE